MESSSTMVFSSLPSLESRGRSPGFWIPLHCWLSSPKSQHISKWYFFYCPWLLLPFLSVSGYLSTPRRNSTWGSLLVVVSSCTHLLGLVVVILPDWGCTHLSDGRLLGFRSPSLWVGSSCLVVTALYSFFCHGDYCFLDLLFWPALVPEDAPIPFLPYFPYDHSRGEGPTEIHLFIFAIVLFPIIESCGDVTSDPIWLSKDTCCLVPNLCCVDAFVQEMVCCFFLGLIEVTSGRTYESYFP